MLENINMDNVSWLFAALAGFAEEAACAEPKLKGMVERLGVFGIRSC